MYVIKIYTSMLTFIYPQAKAVETGSPYHTIDRLLGKEEIRYNPVNEESSRDVDALNTDIAHAALKLLKSRGLGAEPTQYEKVFGRLTDEGIREGLKCRPPCRFETFTKLCRFDDNTCTMHSEVLPANAGDYDNDADSLPISVVLDIAHNKDAIIAFTRKLRAQYPPDEYVFRYDYGCSTCI
jgi:folylpolyglutamate synthase/dihydropteroate synthase